MGHRHKYSCVYLVCPILNLVKITSVRLSCCIDEFQAVLLADSSNNQMKRLQVVQNKALHFAYDVRWPRRVTNDALHQIVNVLYIHDRLSTLQSTVFKKLHEAYVDKEQFPPSYTYSNFRIEAESFYPQSNEVKRLLGRFALSQRLQPPDE